MALVSFMRAWGGAGDWVACWHSGGHAGAWGLAKDVAQLLQALLHLRNAGQLLLQPLPLLCEAQAHRRVQLLKLPAALAVELQQVRVVFPVGTRWDRHCGHPIPQGRPRHQGHLPQRGPVGDGQQRNARVLGCLEDLALHIDAHSAGTFIQQGILGPVIEHAGHTNPLLLTPRQHVLPVTHCLPTCVEQGLCSTTQGQVWACMLVHVQGAHIGYI